MNISTFRQYRPRSAPRSFTLTELLVAIGIIAVLAALTVFSVQGVAKSARLSSATNTVVAVLGNARALAMRNNRLVLVVFRVNWDPQNPARRQFTEAVIAEWRGDSGTVHVPGEVDRVVDRFVPVTGMLALPLSDGIKVAGPKYGAGPDDFWITQTELRLAATEQPGGMISIMFGPDGTVLTQNPRTDSNRIWVDFNNDNKQQINGAVINYASGPIPTIAAALFNGGYFEHRFAIDEPYLDMVPFVAAYDDDDARRAADPTTWSAQTSYEEDLVGSTGYIGRNSDRIHFNRYSGVAMTTRGGGG